MLAEMRRSDRLEFWSETLQVESDSVCAALLDVASLVSVKKTPRASCLMCSCYCSSRVSILLRCAGVSG